MIVAGALAVLACGPPATAGGGAEGAVPPLRSGAEIDYPPFSIVDENGEAGGFSVELMRAALAAMGRGATFRTGPWAEVRGWLERGEIDALPLVGRTPEREALFDFTVPYMSLHGAIVVRDGATDIRDLDDLKGRRVAVMKGDNAEEFLRREERGIDIRATPTFETALRELSEGRCDAVVAQRLVALRLIRKTGLTDLRAIDRPIEGFKQDFCFAVREGDRETLAMLNEGLAIVVADGTYRHLHAKWFAAMQLPWDRPVAVGGDRNFPPYEFLDENGHPAGYNVDLTRAIARETGLNIEIRLGRWPERIQALKTGKIDLLQGMFYSPGRHLTFDFTQPHLVSHYVAVTRKGEGPPPESADELSGKRLVVEGGDILHDFVLKNGLEKRATVVGDQEEALRELSQGRHDCALVSRITALHLMEKHGWSNLVLARKPLLALEYCYAAAKGRKAVLAHFGEGLKALEESGEYRRIRDKWLGVYREEPDSMLAALRYSALVVVPLLLILSIAFAWSWTLRRQVAEKTKALRESLDRFRYVFQAANVGKSLTLPSGEIDANQAFADFLGYSPDELRGKKWQDLTPPEDVEATEKAIAPLLAGEKDAVRLEKRYVHKSGELRWADVSAAMRRDDRGGPLYFMTTVVDVTAQKQAQAALRTSEEYQRAMIDCSPVALYSVDLEGNVLTWNSSAEKIFGWRAEEVVGKPLPIVPARKQEEFRMLRKEVLEKGGFFGKELLRLKKGGEEIPVSLSAAPVRNDRGEIVGIMGAAEDITERKESESRLKESEARFRSIVENAPEPIFIQTDMRFAYLNPKAIKLFGAEDGRALLGTPVMQRFHPDFHEQVKARVKTLNEDRKPVKELFEQKYLRMDGSSVWVETTGQPIVYHGENGALVFVRDISARKAAEKERKRLESQLIQAQKMESVGRLAGGVAHDYNNMLSVIIGYAELAMDQTPPEDSVYDDLREILEAARRSADITRQLLAFARRQTIDPKTIDLNATVESTLKMLRRLIGEDIDLSWRPGSGLWPVHMDPSQLDQILANLCVNARDAIAGVGVIVIETDNVRFDEEYCAGHAGFVPGEYVLLAVSDDGCGMDQETLDHVFEPFFTTKGAGRGTGLGLATVYGVVKQNEGFVNVYSEPEKGTVFRIYLRRHVGEAEEAHERDAEEIPVGRGETVLVVEDESSILKLAKAILEKLGYAVLDAATPGRALALAEAHAGDVHLLLTDVVMPEMNGRELAQKLRALHPAMKVLYMSGYTANVIAHRGVLDEGVSFVQKPFSNRDLAVKVRGALDG